MSFWDIMAAPFVAPTQGAMNILGGVTGQSAADANAANATSAEKAFQASQGSADKQMAFQERMSNTAYTRAMADMKNAGLNPMLAFSQGGASQPSGSSATATAATNQDVGAAATSNLSKLVEGGANVAKLPDALSQMKAQTQQASAQAAQTQATTPTTVAKQVSEAKVNNSTAALQAAQAVETAARTKVQGVSADKISEEIKNIIKSGRMQDLDNETKQRVNEWIKKNPYLFRTKQTLDHLNPFKTLK